MLIPTREQLAAQLGRGPTTLERCTHLGQQYVTLTTRIGGHRVQFTVAITEVLDCSGPGLPSVPAPSIPTGPTRRRPR